MDGKWQLEGPPRQTRGVILRSHLFSFRLNRNEEIWTKIARLLLRAKVKCLRKSRENLPNVRKIHRNRMLQLHKSSKLDSFFILAPGGIVIIGVQETVATAGGRQEQYMYIPRNARILYRSCCDGLWSGEYNFNHPTITRGRICLCRVIDACLHVVKWAAKHERDGFDFDWG